MDTRPILVVLVTLLAGCTTSDDHSGEPDPALDIWVSSTATQSVPWTDLSANMPSLVAYGMDRAEASSNGHFVQPVTLEEKATIEQSYEAAWSSRHGGAPAQPYAIERNGTTFTATFMFGS